MKQIRKQFQKARILALKAMDALNTEDKEFLSELEKEERDRILYQDILDPENFNAWKNKRDAIDMHQQWQLFLDNMNKQGRQAKVRRLRRYYIPSAAAAILALFLTYNYRSEEADNMRSVSEISISSGTSEAELVLSSGEVVHLGKSEEMNLEESTAAITNAEGILAYQQKNQESTAKTDQNSLRIPRGGEYQIVLSDSSRVWLNSETELVYPVAFNGDERRVYLKGEAYFEVSKNKAKPFIVVSSGQEVQVLGTKFNISAYPSDKTTVTTLAEGKVKVKSEAGTKNEHESYLFPDEQLLLDNASGNVQKNKVQSYLYTSWKNGRFIFKNEKLESFFTKLSRWYDVDVVIKDDDLKNIRFTGDLPRYKDMTSILRVIEADMSVHIQMGEDGILYISK
ncbi:FecR family protein [Robertkochia solimangrovi]|uniref:FecR family protein n=1 Tax=Robertkochia solimangrovi TaxID=2213046 RepID=UPI0011816109|nr:FecR family protein [Robertkochia solimangrovi]TRZ45069.1 hypothetical protein DMZ48_04775 [Robertkochia solimangrovi]